MVSLRGRPVASVDVDQPLGSNGTHCGDPEVAQTWRVRRHVMLMRLARAQWGQPTRTAEESDLACVDEAMCPHVCWSRQPGFQRLEEVVDQRRPRE